MHIAEQWLAQGRAEGEVAVLLKQLTLRFGPLDAETMQRVHHATIEERILWTERVLAAATLDELFR